MSDVSEAQVKAAARVMADLCDRSIIEAPKLPWPCWMGSAREILTAAAKVMAAESGFPHFDGPNTRHGYPDEDDGPSVLGERKGE